MINETNYNNRPLYFLAMLIVVLICAGVAVWWLESRFGAAIAILTLGLVFGVGIFIFGALFGKRATLDGAEHARETMSAAAYATVDGITATQKAQIEVARGERYATQHSGQISVINARQSAQLGQQAARAAFAARDAAEREASQAPTWDEAAGSAGATFSSEAGVQYYD